MAVHDKINNVSMSHRQRDRVDNGDLIVSSNVQSEGGHGMPRLGQNEWLEAGKSADHGIGLRIQGR